MKQITIGTAATDTGGTSAFAFDCVALNLTAGSIAITGSDTSGGTYTAVATVPAGGAVNVSAVPRFLKGATAGVILLSSLT